jgi:hypothetical protein
VVLHPLPDVLGLVPGHGTDGHVAIRELFAILWVRRSGKHAAAQVMLGAFC